MINITDKTKCCGCSACFNICPKEAISMEYDSEGFLYPKVNRDKCIKCGLCLKVCPIRRQLVISNEQLVINDKDEIKETLQKNESIETAKDNKEEQLEISNKQLVINDRNKVLEVYGAKNKNVDEQLKSSSGGMFSIFANYVLEQSGIVFGASFDNNWKVVHKYIDNKKDLDDLRRSKYVQSDINITYKQAKQFLDEGKFVLFTGTPCQIVGLKSFLQKDYKNLLTVDIICHGVPSPKVWEKFLNENFYIKNIKEINFRDKYIGWIGFFDSYVLNNKKYKDSTQKFIKLIKVKKIKNILISQCLYSSFFKGFLKNLFLRPTCYQCFFKNNINSDFTIGDLWGVNKILPKIYDNKGVSVLTVNSQKGKTIFEKIKTNIEYTKINYDYMSKYNKPFLSSVKSHPQREDFFKRYQSENLNELISKCLNDKPLIIKVFKKAIKKIYR